ncbi:MAG: hypothetical protein M0R68_03940, partial [Bacteroidetes bacterium]|nr:hypothetical protein [Bacteroidota bacterium]
MAIDLKSYYEQNRNYYGDVPLEEVAKDVHTRSNTPEPYENWLNTAGIKPQIDEDNTARAVTTAQNQEIGVARQFGRGVLRGVTQALPQAVGQGIQWLNPDEGGSKTLEDTGKAIEQFGTDNTKRFPGLTATKQIEADGVSGFIHKAAAGAGESMATSLTPFAVGTAVGLGTANPVLGVAAAGASLVPLFYAPAAEQKYREGEAQGLSHDQNMINANIAGLSEVATEAVSDIIPTRVFGFLKTPAKDAIIKGATNALPLKEILKNMFKVGVAETSTEVLNTGVQAASDKYFGINPEQNVASDMADAAGSAAIMTLVFSAFGIPFDIKHRQSIRATLTNPEADTKDVHKAIGEVAHAVAKEDPDLAKKFTDQALALHTAKQPILLDDDEYYKKQDGLAEATKAMKAQTILSLAKQDAP